jgi:hypothetical protein
MSGRIGRRVALVVLVLAGVGAAMLPVSAAAFQPTVFVLSFHIGSHVNKTTGVNVCTVKSGNECQSGVEGAEPDGFKYPESVAVENDPTSAGHGNFYVADRSNSRIQEFTPAGVFVLMFGWKVDKTTGANVCTRASGHTCGPGEAGTGLAEQLGSPGSVVTDPKNGDVYVLDKGYNRVDEYTEDGAFVLMIGGEVNETTNANVCVAGEKCKSGVESAPGSTVHGAFKTCSGCGNDLAVGGPKDLLYVGDEGRVQEFEASGSWADDLSLAALSTTRQAGAVAVDPSGDVFVSEYAVPGAGVREYDSGKKLLPIVIGSTSPNVIVNAAALDPYGRLGVIEQEPVVPTKFPFYRSFGVLYKTSGERVGEFEPSPGEMGPYVHGLNFDASEPSQPLSDRLYVANGNKQEIEAYVPVVFPETNTCAAEAVMATDATLCGEIDPNSLLTRGFFRYGIKKGELPSETPTAFEGQGEAFVPVHWHLTGLVPNQAYWYETIAEAEVNGKREKAAGQEVSFHTATPPPEVPGEPSASFVTDQSAVLSASVNPEHAMTRYHFEYGPCGTLTECAEARNTASENTAPRYGLVGVTQEATALLPATTYSYRVIANNEFEYEVKPEGGQTPGIEGQFTTAPAPVPTAQTGGHSAVTATGVIVSGEVDPDGQPATYAFELGVYDGAGTQYGTVFSGPAGAGTTPVMESLGLYGLQPGTTYAYRITISSGYVKNESHTVYGATETFKTAGLPSVLTVPNLLAMLPVPPIKFPEVAVKPLTNAQKLANALKVCKKKPRKQRSSCERTARKKYGAKPKPKKKK